MFLARRPSSELIGQFLARSVGAPLSYDPVGLARHPRPGFTVDEQIVVVGSGEAVFRRAVQALAAWRHFELGWVEIFPRRAPIEPGTVVAVLARHLGFWSLNACRVVYAIGERPGREFGFAYGTLLDHAESGEEIFTVSLAPSTGEVSYMIRAVARARAPLARLGYPVTRALQARFRRGSARALASAVAEQ